MNKKRLTGAYPIRITGKWQAAIRVKGERLNLGTFNSAEEAHRAYLKMRRKHPYHAGANKKLCPNERLLALALAGEPLPLENV